MKTQKELAETIQKDMEEMGYLAIPDFSKMSDLIDTEGYDLEKKKAYYQNLSKLALEQAFDELLNEFGQNKIQ
jgi:hypothetical protein